MGVGGTEPALRSGTSAWSQQGALQGAAAGRGRQPGAPDEK
jgi:hypothetical protein